MPAVILRPNAIPVYGFLSTIHAHHPQDSSLAGKKILDCGAGGRVPPLALFWQHGIDGWGIDSSEEQLKEAEQYCRQNQIDLHLQEGDMRCLPFEDESFDYVYEHYSMCHLSKADTARAVWEMHRVLKPQGLCFLGVISTGCWPKSMFGVERERGEYWGEEDASQDVLHSLFSDEEADELAAGWEVIRKEKQVRYLREAASKVTPEEWMKLRAVAGEVCSAEAWQEKYAGRANEFRYVHLYFMLRKTG